MKILSALLFILFFYSGFATTYYISPNGNDRSGNGSQSTPWQSLYLATSSVNKPGDIIHVMAGTYNETITSNLAIGVSIEGEGATSIIQSTVLSTEFIPLITAASAEGTSGNQHISNIKLNGNNKVSWAIVIAGRSNFSIHDCTIVDFIDRGIVWGGRSDGTDTEPALYATGNTFYNNTVANCATYEGFGRGCLNIGGQQGMLIYNNNISQTSRPHGKNGWPIKYWNGGWLKGLKIYNNTITKAVFGGTYNGDNGWDFAIELWNQSGTEIYNNKIQGAVDLCWNVKGQYPYSVYVHDNFIGQPALNTHRESGIILEEITEKAIIEKNQLKNVCTGIAFSTYNSTPISDVIIKDNIMENIGTLNTGKGSFGAGIEFYSDGHNNYSIDNFTVVNNKIIANSKDNPWNGLAFGGAAYIQNLKVQNNTIANFSAGYITINPASVVDTLIIENNTLYGNANNNEPFFLGGLPKNLIQKSNQIKKSENPSANPSINFKQHILKPLYYDLKRTSVLEFIALFSIIISIWFCYKENIYVYPLVLINIVIRIFLSFDEGLPGEAIISFYFIIMCAYGWFLWSKRDKRKHRIVRVTSSTGKEWLIQFGLFIISYVAIFICVSSFKSIFSHQITPVAYSFVSAAAFTGMWLTIKKKTESWYWWIAACLPLIPLYFITHLILDSAYYSFLLLLLLPALYEWRKRKIKFLKRKQQHVHAAAINSLS
ncbi:nicotinamide riboside transporter PnuC [Ferruginibacter sp.]|nr:hypothetical protein [Ferruginibacter sp.]